MSKKKLDELGVSAFCESMAMMLQAGIQIDEAIDLLQSEHGSGTGVLEKGLAVMKKELDGSSGLADAMRKSGVFPDYAIQMIESGEDYGRLEDILFRLSDYYADQKTIADKLRGALTYPAAMLVLIIAVLTVMLAMVLPAFTDVYESLTGSLAASSYRYVYWAYAICWIALGVMLLLSAALLIGFAMWKTGKRGKVEALLRKNKLCASILESMGMFRFTAALGTFLASGDMQDDAMEKSVPMTDCAPVEERLRRCMKRMKEEGRSIAQTAYDEDLFEPVYGRMLLAGERSGNLERVLRRLSMLLQQKCNMLVDRLVGIVDPALSGILMATIGLSLLSVMLPLIGMMNSVG